MLPQKVIQTKKIRVVDKSLALENALLKEKLKDKKKGKPRFDFTTSIKISAGTIFKGTLLNPIVSSNLESPVSVKVTPNKTLKDGGTFLCKGARADRRVYIACDRLMVNNYEYKGLTSSLLNLDGSNGIKGKYWSGEEQYIAGIAATSFASGVIASSQETFTTPYGEQTINNSKNRLYGGLASTANEVTQIMADKLEKSNGIVSIKAGTEVLIYFNQGYSI